MKFISKDRIIGSAVISLFSLSTTLFGGYLLYEKVFLSLLTGQTAERAGIILRADDPVFFWIWVVTYVIAGTIILCAGILLFGWMLKYWLKTHGNDRQK